MLACAPGALVATMSKHGGGAQPKAGGGSNFEFGSFEEDGDMPASKKRCVKEYSARS